MKAVGKTPDPSVRAADEIARELGVDVARGLSAAEAARRLSAK